MMNILITFFGLLAILLYPLGQFSRISFYNQQVNLYPFEIILAIHTCILMLRYGLQPVVKTMLSKTILFFLGILYLSYFINYFFYDGYSNMVAAMYLVRLTVYLINFTYFVYHLKKQRHEKKHLYRELLLIVGILIVSSVLQYMFYPNLRNLLYQGWDPHLYRVFGFFFEPYLAGGALGLSLIFVYFRVLTGRGKAYLKYLLAAVLFILIMLTFSRTTYVAVLTSLIILFIRRKNLKGILIIIGAFVILAYLIPKPVGVGVQLFRTFSVDARVRNSMEGIKFWTKNPFLGVGYDRIRYAKAKAGLVQKYDSSHAAASYHSSFVTMLVAGGVVGVVGMLILLGVLAKLSIPSFYYILFLSILSLGDNALLHTFMLFFYLKLLAFESVQSSLE